MTAPTRRIGAVIVDHHAGEVLLRCVASFAAQPVDQIVVVENGEDGGTARSLAEAGLLGPATTVLATAQNLGYGGGANRGTAALGDAQYVLIANPDLELHPGAVETLARVLDDEPSWAIVGPRILTPEGEVYPSVRHFPSLLDAAGHALVGFFVDDNPFTRRYRPPIPDLERPSRADWVSGACFLARRDALEELGGFDESYFMFAEDIDLCWRAGQAGWGVGYEPRSVVTHLQGVSTRRYPYRMVIAHHRSAFRFARRSTTGWRRAALPLGAAVLGVRLVIALGGQAIALRRSRGPS